MEAIAFAIGLDPILTRGQQLLDQYRTWKGNTAHAPELCEAFAHFEADLAACITRLQGEAEKLPHRSRVIIEADIATLTTNLIAARTGLQNVRRRLNRARLIQFLRANAIASDCDRVSAQLEKARKLLREAVKHADVRSAIHENGVAREATDTYRPSFPPRLGLPERAVLDFDSRDENGNPRTPEARVKRFLLDESITSTRVISIHGIGGVGKSTILKALTVDEQVRTHFCDGLFVIKLGAMATTATFVREICKILKTSGARSIERSVRARNDIDQALHEFQSWFRGRRCAFFIDDAWIHGIGIAIFSQVCQIGRTEKGSAVVITTREHEIASLAPIDRIVRLQPRAMRGNESRKMLFFHAECQDRDCGEDADECIAKILDQCAGLPVCLAVAGKNVKMMAMDMPGRDELAWQRYASQLAICRDSVLRMEVDQYGNLFATFTVSITFLDERPRDEILFFASRLSFGEMHRRLCVIERQAVVPTTMLKHLWEVQSEKHAEVIGRKFIEMGLASSEVVPMDSHYAWHLSLHDTLHDFARMEANRNNDSAEAHEALLKGYSTWDRDFHSESEDLASWWSRGLQADGYIHRNLCRHLFLSQHGTELLRLLMTPKWVERQLEMNDLSTLEGDFALGRKATQVETISPILEDPSELETALSLISEAVALSSSFVDGNLNEFSFQLHARLKGLAKSNRWILEYVDCIESEGPKPLLRSVNPFLMEPGGVNRRITAINAPVLCMQVMNDGERVACGCRDGRIVIANVSRNEIEDEWKAHDDGVLAIALATGKGKKLIVSGSRDGKAKVWDIEAHLCVTAFEDHTDALNCLSIMENGNWIVSGSDDRTAQVWDMNTGKVSTPLFRHHKDAVQCVAVLPDGEHVVTGGADNMSRTWKVTNTAHTGNMFEGHKSWVTCLVMIPEGERILSGSCDNTIRMWDVAVGKQIGEPLEGHTKEVTCMTVSADGGRIVSGSEDKTIRLWDAHSMKELCRPLEGHASSVTGVSFLPDGHSIVSCSNDGTVRVWDLRQCNLQEARHRHEGAVTSVSFMPNGCRAVSGSIDGTLRIWDTKTGQLVEDALRGHTDYVTGVAVLSDNQRVVSVSFDKTVRIWDLSSHRLLHTLKGHNRPIHCVAVTRTGDYAVTGARDATVRLWNLEAVDGGHITLEGHSAGISRIFMSDDGLRVISVAWNGEVFVWELKTQRCLQQIVKNGSHELQRDQIMELAGEVTEEDSTVITIPFWGRTITYGKGRDAQVLATLEADIRDWELSPDKRVICAGLQTGQVAFMRLDV